MGMGWDCNHSYMMIIWWLWLYGDYMGIGQVTSMNWADFTGAFPIHHHPSRRVVSRGVYFRDFDLDPGDLGGDISWLEPLDTRLVMQYAAGPSSRNWRLNQGSHVDSIYDLIWFNMDIYIYTYTYIYICDMDYCGFNNSIWFMIWI